jgi:hypothetical protein
MEFERKVRVITRGLRAVMARANLLNARKYGFYSVQLFSHKVLRRLMAIPLAVLAATSVQLWRRGHGYRLLTIGQLVAYGCAAIGLVAQATPLGQRRLFALPAFFCLVNAASMVATANVLLGRRIERWEPRRSALESAGPAQAEPRVPAGHDARP